MADRVAQQGTRVVDPNIFIPPGMENWEYDESALFGDDDDVTEDGDTPAEGEEGLRPPNFLNVVSQTIRTKANGSQVVDMVIEVEDIPGAIKYELRVTKA